MSVPPPERPRSALLGVLDGIFLVLGIACVCRIAVLRRFPVEESLDIAILRATLGAALVSLSWGLVRTIQERRRHHPWALVGNITLILLATMTLAGWSLQMHRNATKAAQTHDIAGLCELVRYVDRIGPLALPARPARTLALEALHRLVDEDQDGSVLIDVLYNILAVGADDPDLADIKHDAATRLAPLARTSADPFLLYGLAHQARIHGWEDDTDCRPLLVIWHERTDNAPY